MNFGFNSNVRVGEALYHVQTEDRGPSHPFLDTVVYHGRTRDLQAQHQLRGVCSAGANAEDLAQKLHERLAQQHREVIAELEAETLPIPSEGKSASGCGGCRRQRRSGRAPYESENLVCGGKCHPRNRIARKEFGAGELAAPMFEAFLERENDRTPCAEAHTDADGRATLKFPMPANVAEGSSLVIRATDGSRYGELRFRLKSKPREKTPAPVSK